MTKLSKKQKQGIGALAILLVSALVMYTIIADSKVGANAANDATGARISGSMNGGDGTMSQTAGKGKSGKGKTHTYGDGNANTIIGGAGADTIDGAGGTTDEIGRAHV